MHDQLSDQQQFFVLIRGYLALGLIVGIAGIGVIMVRAVRERRRQVGVLRALGVQAAAVRAAFVIESAFVAIEGLVIGTVLALVTAWSITLTDAFGAGLAFRVPVRRDRRRRDRHAHLRVARDRRAGPRPRRGSDPRSRSA